MRRKAGEILERKALKEMAQGEGSAIPEAKTGSAGAGAVPERSETGREGNYRIAKNEPQTSDRDGCKCPGDNPAGNTPDHSPLDRYLSLRLSATERQTAGGPVCTTGCRQTSFPGDPELEALVREAWREIDAIGDLSFADVLKKHEVPRSEIGPGKRYNWLPDQKPDPESRGQ